ncbi:MAG TPA: hypothetical protein VM118_09360 [Acidobacteriota bacterium]|nr:hypothetical protein [Acidobacteriota bacterium]
MTNVTGTTRANRFLVFLVGLLAGVIIGYAVGEPDGVRPVARGAITVQFNDVLAPENAWIVEGFICPMPNCTNPLLTCPGELSRRIRDWVNSQLQLGRPGQAIRAEIVEKHSQNLFKAGLDAPPPDSLRSEP